MSEESITPHLVLSRTSLIFYPSYSLTYTFGNNIYSSFKSYTKYWNTSKLCRNCRESFVGDPKNLGAGVNEGGDFLRLKWSDLLRDEGRDLLRGEGE